MRLATFLLLCATCCTSYSQAPEINKIDPPNWFPQEPAPMLLLQGKGLADARFTLSDPTLTITRTAPSANGHWAQLWLSASPTHPETIQIKAHSSHGEASAPYTFAPRKAPTEGFQGFSSKDVMYLIMTDRFANGDPTNDGPDHASELLKPRGWHGGDLAGIIQHLPYLQQLGITTVWITPVYQNHGHDSYHGYGATDMFAVDEHFGNLQTLKDLATALHAKNMKLVLDSVPNHVGSDHIWTTDSPDPTWFHGTVAHHTIAQGDFDPATNPHAPLRDQENVTRGWFANVLPDLNQEDPAVARYLIQNSIWWIEEAGLDGLRIDTFPYVGRAFWQDFHAQIHALYPHLTTVGEVFNGDPTVTSTYAGGVTRTGMDTGLDTPFDFPSYFQLRNVFLKDAPMTELARILRLDNLFPHPERLVPFLGNHDTERFMSEPGASLERLQLAFTVLTTMRGMPQIYSGDELAMYGGEDPDNRHDFPGGFPDDKQPSAFEASTRSTSEQQAFGTVQRLLALRRAHPALEAGTEQIVSVDKDTMVYVRTLGEDNVLVAVNKSLNGQTITVKTDDTALEGLMHGTILSLPGFPAEANALAFASGALTLRLAPNSAMLAELKR